MAEEKDELFEGVEHSFKGGTVGKVAGLIGPPKIEEVTPHADPSPPSNTANEVPSLRVLRVLAGVSHNVSGTHKP